MAQVINFPQGTFRLVQASASADGSNNPVFGMITASAPTSALFPFIQEGASFDTNLAGYEPIMAHGKFNHWVYAGDKPGELKFKTLDTGTYPTAATAQGASVPMWHAEYKATQPEVGSGLGTGRYFNFYYCVVDARKFTDAMKGNMLEWTVRWGSASGWNASGYLS